MDEKRLLAVALKFLGYRPRSKKEILQFLHQKTSDETQINQVLDQLTKLKLVDDKEFTDWLVKSRSRNKGSLFIKQDLKKFGIDEKNVSIEDELGTAVNLLLKKKPADKIKAQRFLAYRGFPANIVYAALKKVYNGKDVN